MVGAMTETGATLFAESMAGLRIMGFWVMVLNFLSRLTPGERALVIPKLVTNLESIGAYSDDARGLIVESPDPT
jgi:hypothetical protein